MRWGRLLAALAVGFTAAGADARPASRAECTAACAVTIAQCSATCGVFATLNTACRRGVLKRCQREGTLVCAPGQAAERLARYIELGFTEAIFVTRFAGISARQERRTIERLTREVRPQLGLKAAA